MSGMKGLSWEVSTRSAAIYYKGRGNTPQEALVDLKQTLEMGVNDAAEQVASQQRRLDAISAYLEDMRGAS